MYIFEVVIVFVPSNVQKLLHSYEKRGAHADDHMIYHRIDDGDASSRHRE